MEKTGSVNKLKKKTYTIFGHTGFIGSFFKNKLFKENLILPKKKQIVFKKNLGHIIYCIGSDDWLNDSYNSYYANLGYLPEIIKKNKYQSFTFLSSTRLYRNLKETDEDCSLVINPTNLDNYYNIKKICAESFLLSQKNSKIKIIRLANIYGFSPNSTLVIPTLIMNAINKKKIRILINKKSSKDFLSIEDVFTIILKIIKNGKRNLYNIGSGKNITLQQIAQKISLYTNCKVIYSNQKKIIKEPIINISKIKKEFKFKPSSSLIYDLPNLIQKYKKV
jgi:nucleoside-diphosphate-sugar epimerase